MDSNMEKLENGRQSFSGVAQISKWEFASKCQLPVMQLTPQHLGLLVATLSEYSDHVAEQVSFFGKPMYSSQLV